MNTNLPLHLRRPVSIRPISAEGWRGMAGDRRGTHRSAVANYIYITRGAGADASGPLDYRHRTDLLAHGLELPANHPLWAAEDGRIWRELDRVTRDLADDAVRAWHVVVTLPGSADTDDWIDMVRRYADTVSRHGPAVAWAIHAPFDDNDAAPPHAHLLVTTRQWRHNARHGETVANWCGPAMTSLLHSEWLVHLPAAMRSTATTPYRVGSFAPARPDLSALENLFGAPSARRARRPVRRSRRRPSHRIRKEQSVPSK